MRSYFPLLSQIAALAMVGALAWTWSASRKTATLDSKSTTPLQSTSDPADWQKLLLADPAKAAAQLQGESRTLGKLTDCVQIWSQQDPRAVLEWIRKVPELGWRQHLLKNLFERITQDDPTLGSEILLELRPAMRADDLVLRLAKAWAEKQPNAAFAWRQTLADARLEGLFTRHVLANWAKKDALAAAKALESLPQSATKQESILDLAGIWGQTDSGAVADWLRHNDATTQRGIFTQVLANLVQTDLELAKRLASAPSAPAEAVSIAARAAAQQNAVEALNWTKSLASGRNREAAELAIISQWALTDPKSAAAAAQLLDSASRQPALAEVLRHWAPRDTTAALEWAKSLPPADASGVYRRLISGSGAGEYDQLTNLTMARAAAYEALQAIDSAMSNETEVAKNAHSIAQKWAESNPSAALDWSLKLQGTARSEALTGALWMGMQKDFAATSQWYLSLETTLQQLGLTGAVRGAAKFHPQTAMDWTFRPTESNTDAPALRREVFQGWLNSEEPTARAWLRGSALPEEERQQLSSLTPGRK